MPAQDYNPLLWSMIEEVRDWSNREETKAIPDSVIKRSLEYAADTSYRTLMVPALEHTAEFLLDSTDFQDVDGIFEPYIILDVPSDLVEFISLRVKSKGEVFNQKVDERTFFDRYAAKQANRFTRIGTKLHIAGFDLSAGETVAVHYRRRLAALDARYSANATNYVGVTAGGTGELTQGTYLYVVNNSVVPDTVSTDVGTTFTAYVNSDDIIITDDASNRPTHGTLITDATNTAVTNAHAVTITRVQRTLTDGTNEAFWAYGKQVPNWLRDENRRCLTFGALYQMFDYFAEPGAADRWFQKFQLAMEELNMEEKKRKASGGNVTINFTSHLI